MKRLPLICAMLSISATCQAGPAVAFGTPDCGRWIGAHTAAMDGWALGYLSGMNAALAKGGQQDPLNSLDSGEQILQWLTNYCQQHPLERVDKAALLLWFELVLKQLPSTPSSPSASDPWNPR